MKMLDMLMAYEDGTLDINFIPMLFQNLIDSGLIFSLQGDYVKVAKELVVAELIETQYGPAWMLDAVEAEKFGRKFVPTGSKSRVQKQLGLTEAQVV